MFDIADLNATSTVLNVLIKSWGLATIFGGIYLWVKGTLPVIYRFGNSIAHKKIYVFSVQQFNAIEKLLIDSGVFQKKNIKQVPKDFVSGQYSKSAVLLIDHSEFKDQLVEILNKKDNATAAIIYAKPGSLTPDEMGQIDNIPLCFVTNFRGRLLSDLVMSMIITGKTN